MRGLKSNLTIIIIIILVIIIIIIIIIMYLRGVLAAEGK